MTLAGIKKMSSQQFGTNKMFLVPGKRGIYFKFTLVIWFSDKRYKCICQINRHVESTITLVFHEKIVFRIICILEKLK